MKVIALVFTILLIVSVIVIFLFSFSAYAKQERYIQMMNKTRNRIIICIMILCVVSGVIYFVADAQWEEEQRSVVAYDFLEAIATVDEAKIDLYCNENTQVSGCKDYYEFRNEIILEWQSSQSEVIRYRITDAPSQLPGVYFYRIEYRDEEGADKSITGSFHVVRKGWTFWIARLTISC